MAHNGFTILDSNQLTTQNGFLKFDLNLLTTQKASRILIQNNSRLKKETFRIFIRINSRLNDAIYSQFRMTILGHSTLLLTWYDLFGVSTQVLTSYDLFRLSAQVPSPTN